MSNKCKHKYRGEALNNYKLGSFCSCIKRREQYLSTPDARLLIDGEFAHHIKSSCTFCEYVDIDGPDIVEAETDNEYICRDYNDNEEGNDHVFDGECVICGISYGNNYGDDLHDIILCAYCFEYEKDKIKDLINKDKDQ